MAENNKFTLNFLSYSQNEAFARSVVSCFALGLNPNVSELSDIKTAVSEAVTNCIVHAYPDGVGKITLEGEIDGDDLHINVIDNGVGIDNLDDALEPFFTTRPDEERSGMGFTIMKSFMDDVKVETSKGKGTCVYMLKKLKADR